MIGGVLLAAGRSTRFGSDKLLAALGGRPVVRWSAESLLGVVDELVVVVPDGDTAIHLALHGLPVRFAGNARRDDGMSSSLAEGISALSGDCEAVLVALGDQPGIRPDVATALIQRWRHDQPAAVAPMYDDGRGHPVLFDRRCFALLVALRGDTGARALLESLGDGVALVRVDGAQPPDVDTPAMLEALERGQRPGS